MEPEGSLPSSQELSTCTYPEPDQSSPQHSLQKAVLSSPNLVTLMIEKLHSSETPLLTKATLRKIPEYGILHSHPRENLKSCM
jgi:hypothetical protein